MIDDRDLLGLQPVSKAIEKSVDGLGAFLGKICMPVAEEIGLYFQDKVKVWRANNATEIGKRAEKLVDANGGIEGKSIHPLLAWKIIENGSFADSSELQDAWAGLLASSCSEHPDDSNHIFIDILSQLTILQVKIIVYSCKNSHIFVSKQGFIYSEDLSVSKEAIFKICDSDDLHRIDREMDKMRSSGLLGLGGGFHPDEATADLTPSPLCLQFYVRCSGFNGSPVDFYKAKEKSNN
ncbi:Abi-alpha family protein [Nitrosomonas sp. wSCUT-2]